MELLYQDNKETKCGTDVPGDQSAVYLIKWMERGMRNKMDVLAVAMKV
jgi:hypothetical protein